MRTKQTNLNNFTAIEIHLINERMKVERIKTIESNILLFLVSMFVTCSIIMTFAVYNSINF